jgi:hypothetical protein
MDEPQLKDFTVKGLLPPKALAHLRAPRWSTRSHNPKPTRS